MTIRAPAVLKINSTRLNVNQGGITCGAIDEPRKSSEAIDKREIIDFRDKNVVIVRFRDQNEVLFYIYYIYIYTIYIYI